MPEELLSRRSPTATAQRRVTRWSALAGAPRGAPQGQAADPVEMSRRRCRSGWVMMPVSARSCADAAAWGRSVTRICINRKKNQFAMLTTVQGSISHGSRILLLT